MLEGKCRGQRGHGLKVSQNEAVSEVILEKAKYCYEPCTLGLFPSRHRCVACSTQSSFMDSGPSPHAVAPIFAFELWLSSFFTLFSEDEKRLELTDIPIPLEKSGQEDAV